MKLKTIFNKNYLKTLKICRIKFKKKFQTIWIIILKIKIFSSFQNSLKLTNISLLINYLIFKVSLCKLSYLKNDGQIQLNFCLDKKFFKLPEFIIKFYYQYIIEHTKLSDFE